MGNRDPSCWTSVSSFNLQARRVCQVWVGLELIIWCVEGLDEVWAELAPSELHSHVHLTCPQNRLVKGPQNRILSIITCWVKGPQTHKQGIGVDDYSPWHCKNGVCLFTSVIACTGYGHKISANEIFLNTLRIIPLSRHWSWVSRSWERGYHPDALGKWGQSRLPNYLPGKNHLKG